MADYPLDYRYVKRSVHDATIDRLTSKLQRLKADVRSVMAIQKALHKYIAGDEKD